MTEYSRTAKPADPPPLVYIGGYGRSGSTLLDTILGNHDQVFGAGELTWLYQQARDGQSCTCGQRVTECTIWSSVLDIVRSQLGELCFDRATRLTMACERVAGSRLLGEQYGQLWSATISAMQKVTGCKTIVDSSKTSRLSCRRHKLLRTYVASGIRLIHLVRRWRSVAESVSRGSNRLLECGMDRPRWGGTFRAAMGWSFANVAMEIEKRRRPRLAHTVHYELMVADPRAVLTRLGNFLSIDFLAIMDSLEAKSPLAPGHGIAGNRMRRSGPVVLRSRASCSDRLAG